MALDVAVGDPELAAAQRARNIVAAATRHSPLADEVAARLCVIARLRRRLAEERMALSDLLERTAIDSHAEQVEAFSGVESPECPGESEPEESKHVTVENRDVAEGERRLAAAGDVGENTRRAYESALRGLDAWLREHRPGEAPNDALLAEYLAVLAAQGRSVSSAAQVVAAVKGRAKLHGDDSPAGEKTAEALRRYRRLACAGRGQVRGISWEEADRMRDLAASAGDVRGLRDAALISMASDALLRVSEVSNVQVGDVAFEDDGSARLLLRRSKTDRGGRGTLLFLGPRTAELVREWATAAGITQGPLFRRIHRSGSVASQGMGTASVRRVIVRRAEAAGISGRVSGHSLRVGSAQSLAKRGAGLVAMQKAGRWASPDMPARYTRSQAAAEGAVARLRHRHGTAAHGRDSRNRRKRLTGRKRSA